LTVGMTRRLDIELTSLRHDGTWTWRAAGAREPRGVIAAKLLEDGAKVGSVLRVEAEFELEGITVVSVLPARERTESENRIEIVPAKSAGSGLVTTSLLSRQGRDVRERPPDGNGRARSRERTSSPRPRGEIRPRSEEGERRRPSRERELGPRPAQPGAARRDRSAVPRAARPKAAGPTPAPEAPAASPPPRRERARPERFLPGTRHRDAHFATLPPEQRPIAEQVAAGGMPAVRRALAAEQSAAVAAGRPAVGGEAIIALAEQLLPSVRQAVWLDRAEAVVAHLDSISLRELRATVLGAAPRDEHGRELLGTIREALKVRLAKLRSGWEGDITRALAEGRVLHALRLSARPPDPGARIPVSLVAPLGEAAGAALAATSSVERWLALLEAAAASPVRRSVKPAGLPEDPTGAVRRAATLYAGRVPALAPLLGLPMPPPPRPISPHPATRVAKPRAPRVKAPGRRARSDGLAPGATVDGTAPAAPLAPSGGGAVGRSEGPGDAAEVQPVVAPLPAEAETAVEDVVDGEAPPGEGEPALSDGGSPAAVVTEPAVDESASGQPDGDSTAVAEGRDESVDDDSVDVEPALEAVDEV
jgi:hypothetical protein